jgi:HEAT repeat protein
MFCSRCRATLTVALFLGALHAAAAQATTPTITPDEKDLSTLAAVLRSDAPQLQKVLACKRLARLGNRDSVPALTPLLGDAQLSHPARLALEAIPDPAAGAALREATRRLKGLPLVGVIGSLGVRRDAQAIGLLERLLADTDAQVAAAAAGALGRIGTPEAAKILLHALPKSAVRNAVADAGLDCAEAAVRTGKLGEALTLYDRLASADVPTRIQAAALRGAILARESAGADRLARQLEAADATLFAVAVGVAREMRDPAATRVLLAALPKLAIERRAVVLLALGDRGDRTARPVVVTAAASPAANVRVAALQALATLGTAEDLPLLLAAAASPDRDTAQAARSSLAALPGVDKALIAALASAKGPARLVLIDVVGRRQIVAAVPTLLASLEAPDTATRLAAIAALGGTIAPKDFPSLLKRLMAGGSPQETAAAQASLRAACSRRPDKQACAEALVASLTGAAPETAPFLVELLGTVGGPTALEAVAAAAKNPDERIQDTATRVLGDWQTSDVAPVLLEVAEKATNPKFRVRALRGYLRVARQMDVHHGQRLAICRKGLELADRDEERKLAIETLSRCASPEALKLVMAHLHTAHFTPTAAASAVTIGEMTVVAQPQAVAAAMREVVKVTTDKNLLRRANDLLRRAETPAK